MNSPTHKANMLDNNFTEVGFGYANGTSYNNAGQETVVVAMYGQPQVLAASGYAPAPAVPAPTATPTPAATPTTSTPSPSPAVPAAEAKPAASPVTTDTPIVTEPATKNVARVQSLTNGKLPWATFAVGLMTGLALTAILLRHAAGLRHLLRDGEKFIMHHALLDTVLVSLVLVGTYLSQATGFIK
jgi:uncharacterized protein YkwD